MPLAAPNPMNAPNEFISPPVQYGVPLGALDEDPMLMERRLDLAHSAALVLDKANLVRCVVLGCWVPGCLDVC